MQSISPLNSAPQSVPRSRRARKRDRANKSVVLIVLMSLAAEGTPRMALALCRQWLRAGIRPVIVTIDPSPDDLAPGFESLGIARAQLAIPANGYRRYVALAVGAFRLARRYQATALLSMPLGWHVFLAIGARLAGVRRVVAHVGNFPNARDARAFAKFRTLVQLGRPLTSTLICCSRYVAEGATERFGVSQRETCVVYNGTAPEDFPFRWRLQRDLANDRFVIGMVARLERHKDHMTLISAAKILAERGLALSVQLIGEGSLRPELEKHIEALGLGEIVHLPGMCRDIAAALSGLDAFVFSTTPDEGFGIALAEAMLSGVPVVASDVGACREVLEGGRCGTLVPPRDPRALADAIIDIFQAPGEAMLRAGRARDKAVRDFSVIAMARAYAKCLGLEATPDATRSAVDASELCV
jgi:glycosyltransferase involved in cell wall biosynthesis